MCMRNSQNFCVHLFYYQCLRKSIVRQCFDSSVVCYFEKVSIVDVRFLPTMCVASLSSFDKMRFVQQLTRCFSKFSCMIRKATPPINLSIQNSRCRLDQYPYPAVCRHHPTCQFLPEDQRNLFYPLPPLYPRIHLTF